MVKPHRLDGDLRALVTLAMLMVASTVRACLWDSDTLAAEAGQKPDMVRVITGRFERNPALFYEMRLARVTQVLSRDRGRLSLYDDAAVACDRLGRDDDAIAWMAKKRAQLKSLGPVEDHKDEWYRTYANEGTFYAHRWLHDGAPSARIAELEKGRDLIETALEVNPDAHFGREVYQLMILDWLTGVKKGAIGEPLGDYLERQITNRELSWDSAAEGLGGLIRLGSAWQSVDVFNALSTVLSHSREGVLAQLARMRAQELKSGGARSLTPGKEPNFMWRPEDRWREYNARQFRKLRTEADRWHADRERYMLVRLKQGRHPDTDAAFWSEYRPSDPPEISAPPFWTSTSFFIWSSIALVLAGLTASLFGAFKLVKWLVRRARAAR